MFVPSELFLVVILSKWTPFPGFDSDRCVPHNRLLLGVSSDNAPPLVFAYLYDQNGVVLCGKLTKPLPAPFNEILVPAPPFMAGAIQTTVAVGNQEVLDLITRSFYLELGTFQRLVLALGYQEKLPAHGIYQQWLTEIKRGFIRELGADDTELARLQATIAVIEGRKARLRKEALVLGIEI